ncbi:MAG: N-6 DNA methylase [Pirellulaceae bacterium]
MRRAIRAGDDPLGEAFCRLRTPAERREQGATYTPAAIVRAMVDWASEDGPPRRVVDPGVGSGRFLLQAAKAFSRAELVGIELDPLAALLARANLAARRLQRRARVELCDFRDAAGVLPPIDGPTLFLGNPPYVRHHRIDKTWKAWLAEKSRGLNVPGSGLAGLHAYFFLATALLGRPGDRGMFITAAEWLDVNYGALVRRLLLDRLGGRRLVLIEPKAMPFPDAATTAVIAQFTIEARPTSVSFQRIENLDALAKPPRGAKIGRARLQDESRWSQLIHASRRPPQGFVELGEICRVHRGQVTGANRVWIAGELGAGLPESVLFPSVTRAKELFQAEGVLNDTRQLRRVIDLPVDLDTLTTGERRSVELFLKQAKRAGADETYIARNRRAWWSVGLRQPAPILATYMARRPPAFVRNLTDARHLNIAHGLYPRERLGDAALTRLCDHLSTNVALDQGRTYAGGLTKFEPKELERLTVPRPE